MNFVNFLKILLSKLENLILKGMKELSEPERAAEAREARRSGEFPKKYIFNKGTIESIPNVVDQLCHGPEVFPVWERHHRQSSL